VWNGSLFVAAGTSLGKTTITSSPNGIIWTAGTGSPFVTTSLTIAGIGRGVAGNSNIGPVIVDSQIILNNNSNNSNKLDIVSDGYYNQGFTNFSFTIKAREL
jgi:hypothetical protein